MKPINRNSDLQIKTFEFHIQGLIQGVGFRPFIYRICKELNLVGFVHNQNNGVVVNLQGNEQSIIDFEHLLRQEAPLASHIESIKKNVKSSSPFSAFTIKNSISVDNSITGISPDIAVCDACLKDLQTQEHRINYPFINCTNCGPRFSIIENLPYDRPYTSMHAFEMCFTCKKEYNSVINRRFHAQPNACNICGPQYEMLVNDNTLRGIHTILNHSRNLLNNGGVIAIKGLGGYHLACDAFNSEAILRLRGLKKRDGKPLAVMFKDCEAVKEYVKLSPLEEELLTSWKRPIVLISQATKSVFPIEIAHGLSSLGVFLPYLPFQHQIFTNLHTKALVMTSGNINDCPIITTKKESNEEFGGKVDAIIHHNRTIINRVDDSVVQVNNDEVQIIRRSRGYTPLPVMLDFNAEGIAAFGAELSNTFCIAKSNQAILSQHIGDLKNVESLSFFEDTYTRLSDLFKFKARSIACDLHPDYLSTRFAKKTKLPLIQVQHHHAHIASVMAEHGINEQVIGVVLDGTGYGTDGKSWGSEIMLADFSSFKRKYHFEYIPVPGGDSVAHEPWRSALAYLYHSYGEEFPRNARFLQDIPTHTIDLLLQALKLGINTPESCSAGRLFDAVAGISNICSHAKYHAEAPIRLEHAAKRNIRECYPIELSPAISWKETIRNIYSDSQHGVGADIISAKFHNTVATIVEQAILDLHKKTGIRNIVLSGGTFQNKYLTNSIIEHSKVVNLNCYLPRQIPCNDGGIALGQLAVAAHVSNPIKLL